MTVSSQPVYFAHANVFHHDGKPEPIESSIAMFPRDGGDPEVICITGMPVEYLPFCVRGKFSQPVRGNISLMVVKEPDQQKNFQELGLFAMALETLPKFRHICDGTFPNSVHEDVHEEEDISCCTMVGKHQPIGIDPRDPAEYKRKVLSHQRHSNKLNASLKNSPILEIE
ncbi:hypothetical protein TNCV_2202581 [Trichonephila clavipes]|uniref:Uncharacterized protein n=1 Tax=Trichonephila clavipes TaxID=2585209 RepID=A0A8X6URA7_TRICX|nr:hypothetical protein TNCV_2202581 [Trichonephila clavipes]